MVFRARHGEWRYNDEEFNKVLNFSSQRGWGWYWGTWLRGAGQIHKSHMQGERCNQLRKWRTWLRGAEQIHKSHMQGERCNQFRNWFSRLRRAEQIHQTHMQGYNKSKDDVSISHISCNWQIQKALFETNLRKYNSTWCEAIPLKPFCYRLRTPVKISL